MDVDPTHHTFPEADHVVTAVGRDFSDVPPNRGVWKGKAEETIAVAVKIDPVERMPPDWTDLGTPTPWSGSVSTAAPRMPRGNGLHHQAVARTNYRHQQSQQQQANAYEAQGLQSLGLRSQEELA